jgi:hypothetical protein
VADSDQTVFGKMIDTIPPSTAIHTDMITSTSQIKNTKISLEAPWAQLKRKNKNITSLVSSHKSQELLRTTSLITDKVDMERHMDPTLKMQSKLLKILM